jgi:HK97 family phage portal protein
MDIFSLFRGSKKKSVEPTYNGTWTNLSNTADGVNERNLLLNNKEWVYIAVDKVASAVAGVNFKVMRYARNGDDQEVFDGPLVQFLEKPGADFTGKDFIYLNTVYKELTGNAFWEKQKGGLIHPLIPTQVMAHIIGGKLAGYKVADGSKQRTLRLDDVLYDRYVDPARPYWGVGKLAKIARWVDTSSYTNEFLRSFFLNGATFGGFITTEEESEDRIKLIKMGLANDHAGVANAHKTGVLPKGADYKKVASNMSELEMGDTDDRYRDKILSAFGVPKTLVGLTTEVNRASAEASEYVFAKYTVKPIVDDLMAFLNITIAPMLDPSGKYYFHYEDFIPENRELDLKEREIALNKQQYKTVNEVRAEEGLPPVPGGDDIYQAPFMVPLGTPQAAPEAPGGDEPEEDAPRMAKARPRAVLARMRGAETRTKALEEVVDGIITKIGTSKSSRDAKDAADHKEFTGRVDQHRDKLADTVRDFNKRQQRDLLARMTKITKDVTKTDLWDTREEVQLMVDAVSPILGSLLTEEAVTEYIAQGFPGTFNSNDVLIPKIVDLAAKRLAKSYNETTAKLITTQLNEGIQNGESLQQLVKRVNSVYEYSDMVRAKAVAHTESYYIANKGNQEAYRQSGVVKTQRWYTAEDEMVCPHCGPMDGRTIDVGSDYFKKGDVSVGADGSILKLNYRGIDVPPLHTNCRCFIRPDVIIID